MAIDAVAFPLYWPQGWPRTRFRSRTSRYSVTMVRARDEVMRTLAGMNATERIISTNVPIRRDGLPAAGCPEPQDPGVAVYWAERLVDAQGRAQGQRHQVIACDRYTTVRDNLRACGLALEGLRAIARSGASQVLDRAYTGFAALPANAGASDWREVLGLDVTSGRALNGEQLKAAYRAMAERAHPDHGGSTEQMASVNRAYADARRELGL